MRKVSKVIKINEHFPSLQLCSLLPDDPKKKPTHTNVTILIVHSLVYRFFEIESDKFIITGFFHVMVHKVFHFGYFFCCLLLLVSFGIKILFFFLFHFRTFKKLKYYGFVLRSWFTPMPWSFVGRQSLGSRFQFEIDQFDGRRTHDTRIFSRKY